MSNRSDSLSSSSGAWAAMLSASSRCRGAARRAGARPSARKASMRAGTASTSSIVRGSAAPNISAMSPNCRSKSSSSVESPMACARSASKADTVLFPAPPLPLTTGMRKADPSLCAATAKARGAAAGDADGTAAFVNGAVATARTASAPATCATPAPAAREAPAASMRATPPRIADGPLAAPPRTGPAICAPCHMLRRESSMRGFAGRPPNVAAAPTPHDPLRAPGTPTPHALTAPPSITAENRRLICAYRSRNACRENDTSMPAALALLMSDPVPSNDKRHTRLSARSRLSVAARLMGSTSSLDATHTSLTVRSSPRNLRAASPLENSRNHSCAARFSPPRPMASG